MKVLIACEESGKVRDAFISKGHAAISCDMLLLAKRRATDLGLRNVEFREGRAEAIPAEDSAFDAVLASLSLMYVIDRARN